MIFLSNLNSSIKITWHQSRVRVGNRMPGHSRHQPDWRDGCQCLAAVSPQAQNHPLMQSYPSQNNAEEKPRVPDRYPRKRGILFGINKSGNEYHTNIDSTTQSRNIIGGDQGDYQSRSSGVTCVLPQKSSGLTSLGEQNLPCCHFS